MLIELAVSCHNFQHRYCWMLSSILEQKGYSLNDFILNTAYIRNTGNPTTEEVLKMFEDAGIVNFTHTAYEDEKEFQYRGLVRNRQLKESYADWIWFGDCDMLVHPHFLMECKALLQNPQYSDTDVCFVVGRSSIGYMACNRLIAGYMYPQVITKPWDAVGALPQYKQKNVGAGYCQIVNVRYVKEHVGHYVDPYKNLDLNWGRRYAKARSDTQFKRAMCKKRSKLPWFVHLQHHRDSDVLTHLEEQR